MHKGEFCNSPLWYNDKKYFFNDTAVLVTTYCAGEHEKHQRRITKIICRNLLIHPAYRHLESALNYPNAMKVLGNVFFIKCSPVITDEMIDYIEEIVLKYIHTIL